MNNQDDGRPLTYKLEYSTDKLNFYSLDNNITDTFYIWAPGVENKENSFWFRLTASTVDGTLSSTTVSDHFIYVYDWQKGPPVFFTNLQQLNSSISDKEVKIYPNPFKNILNIRLAGNSKIEGIRIYNVTGGIIFYDISPGKNFIELNLSGISPGIYFISIYYNDKIVTEKIIHK